MRTTLGGLLRGNGPRSILEIWLVLVSIRLPRGLSWFSAGANLGDDYVEADLTAEVGAW